MLNITPEVLYKNMVEFPFDWRPTAVHCPSTADLHFHSCHYSSTTNITCCAFFRCSSHEMTDVSMTSQFCWALGFAAMRCLLLLGTVVLQDKMGQPCRQQSGCLHQCVALDLAYVVNSVLLCFLPVPADHFLVHGISLFFVRKMWSPISVCYPPTAIHYPPTAVDYPPTAVGFPPTAVGFPPTTASCSATAT